MTLGEAQHNYFYATIRKTNIKNAREKMLKQGFEQKRHENIFHVVVKCAWMSLVQILI